MAFYNFVFSDLLKLEMVCCVDFIVPLQRNRVGGLDKEKLLFKKSKLMINSNVIFKNLHGTCKHMKIFLLNF